MTTTIAREVQRRRPGAAQRARNLDAFAHDLVCRALADYDVEPSQWPSDTYRANPVAFFREILGVEPWTKQVQVIEAVRDHKRVAVRAGHKVSKSHTIAGIALWFFSGFDDARVVMTSTTARQVDQILWRELKMMHARAGRCTACKATDKAKAARGERVGPRPCPHSALLDGTGEIPELARTGLKTEDFREVVGFTARESEAVAGISGKNLLYLVDEASGVPDLVFEAIEGNRAGGARIALFGNPTRNEGEFYEAFEGAKKDGYHTITVSSEETPNVVEGRDVIPGLATREWVDERAKEWGKDSALYQIRVKGVHALREEGKAISVHLIKEAEERWSDTQAEGRLIIGVDPAGPGLFGDESAFAPRRGQKILSVTSRVGLDEYGVTAYVAGLVRELAPDPELEEELPLVIVDKGGAVGTKVYVALVLHARANARSFVVIGVDSSRKAEKAPEHFELVRDELWDNGASWLKNGGAIPANVKLAKDLHTPEWEGRTGSERLRITDKAVIRKRIGRSTDLGDAVLLAVWEPLDVERFVNDQLEQHPHTAPSRETDARAGTIDAYDWEKAFRRRGGP